MRKPFLLALAALSSLAACSDSDPPTFDGIPLTTVFTHTWSEGEMSGLAYDPATDALFLIEDVHGGQNAIHRWSFEDETLREVYRYTSQHDYGLRRIGDELWVVRTYDMAFLRLGGLASDTLTPVGEYVFAGTGSKATEVNDVAPHEDDLFFVAGNPLGSDQHDGIQVLVGPDYSTITELLGEAQANWNPPGHGFWRAIVVTGEGASSLVAVATGDRQGPLTVYDLQGTEQLRVANLGSSYLAKDSLDRVYAIRPSNGSVLRFSPDFQTREDFETNLPGGEHRFAIRETTASIELIYAPVGSEETTVGRVVLPK